MDFLGTTSSIQLISYITQGVQITGTQLYPLASMAGVPVAFIVAYYLVRFIKGNISNNSSGYYKMTKDGSLEYDDNQKEAELKYNLQERGYS